MRRHQLQNEGQGEEDSPTPPTSFGKEVSRLTLSALQQNREHQHDAIDYQQR